MNNNIQITPVDFRNFDYINGVFYTEKHKEPNHIALFFGQTVPKCAKEIPLAHIIKIYNYQYSDRYPETLPLKNQQQVLIHLLANATGLNRKIEQYNTEQQNSFLAKFKVSTPLPWIESARIKEEIQVIDEILVMEQQLKANIHVITVKGIFEEIFIRHRYKPAGKHQPIYPNKLKHIILSLMINKESYYKLEGIYLGNYKAVCNVEAGLFQLRAGQVSWTAEKKPKEAIVIELNNGPHLIEIDHRVELQLHFSPFNPVKAQRKEFIEECNLMLDEQWLLDMLFYLYYTRKTMDDQMNQIKIIQF